LRPVALAFVATVLVGCDRWEGVTVRNDAEVTLTFKVAAQNAGKPEFVFQTAEIGPGITRDLGKIGGPPDPAPDIIVRAYSGDTLVYCRRFTEKQFSSGSRTPVSVTRGDIRCR